MSEKQFGFKMRLGLNNVETLIDLLNITSERIRKALLVRKVTPGYKLARIKIIDNQDFSYSIMFNFDNELSINEIFNKAILEEND